MENIYFFDPLVALEVAKRHQITDTNLQTNQEQICFYNGEVFANMPSNCISVPINNFYNYFFTTTHALPQQINFDNQAFNDSTKQEITQSIIDTLTQVKEARIQIIIQVLQAPIQHETTPAYIILLLDYLQFIDAVPQEIEKEILYKLLDLVRFSINKQLILPQELLDKVTTLFEFIQNRHPKLLEKNIRLMHLQYALYSLLTNTIQLDVYFENLLQLLNDLPSVISDYNLVTHVFTEAQLGDYLKKMHQALFHKTFMSENIVKQKQIIYKFFFLTNLVYGRGKAYQEMYYFLHPYFLEAINKGLEELTFYLYTPLLMSWNGTVQTQEEFKKFNDEVEKPLEVFISNTLIPKYKLKPNTGIIDNKKTIKVAFLQERIINYSVYKVFYSLLKTLTENSSEKYEFIIYDLNFMEFGGSDLAIVEELKKLGINYIDLHKECAADAQGLYPIVDKSLKIRQKLINDNIDILIGMNTRPEYNFLFTTRTAPKQIYWSHGCFEYNLENIDLKISHFFVDSTCSEQYQRFMIPENILDIKEEYSQELIKQTKTLYPVNTILLGSIGRLIKIDNIDYLYLVKNILQKYPNTIYLACGSGETHSIKLKLQEINIPLDRFIFTGQINTGLYANIIDIFMDTFPFYQGSSRAEYMANSTKGVALRAYIKQEERFKVHVDILDSLKKHDFYASTLKKNHIDPNEFEEVIHQLLVQSTQEYLSVMDLYISDPALREKTALYAGKILLEIQSHIHQDELFTLFYDNILSSEVK